MNIVLGGTGHVGSAVAQTLLNRGEKVLLIARNRQKAEEWKQKGAQIELADVHNTDALHSIFLKGEKLFLLNPPADPGSDTAIEERKTVSSILKAVKGSALQKIVALSTYGAQRGDQIGDLGVLYEMEQALTQQSIPFFIIRAAYYMSNWDMSLESAQQEGKVYSFFPPDFKLPMVDPSDIGKVAAKLLMENATGKMYYVEGPEHYSSTDVASAFARALRKPVQAVEIPREQWITTMQQVGFSAKAAESMAAMTAITIEKLEVADNPVKGGTTLEKYVQRLVNKMSTI